MTYEQAKVLCEQRGADWAAYYQSCGKPNFQQFEDCVNNSPEGVFNYNIISRSRGVFIAVECPDGVYEYPAGLLAWGGKIPEDAFVSKEDLDKDYWEVCSHKEIFDW